MLDRLSCSSPLGMCLCITFRKYMACCIDMLLQNLCPFDVCEIIVS